MLDQTIGQRMTDENSDTMGLLHRAVRLALVAYLLPVLLLVLAIGLVGMVASHLGRQATRPPITGVHKAHGKARPLAVGRVAARESRVRV